MSNAPKPKAYKPLTACGACCTLRGNNALQGYGDLRVAILKLEGYLFLGSA